MTLRRKRDQLKVEILETERLIQQVSGHPVMSFSLKQRLADLNRQLGTIPMDAKEPTVTLLFFGKPVYGSVGIEADFLGQAILPFQKMVQADLTQRGYGKVGSRGQIKRADEAKLFLTALPRGSFGIELSKLESNSLFGDDELSDSLAHVSKLIESSAKSDEDFAVALDNVSQRVMTGLRQFLNVVSSDKAGLTIESGGMRSTLEVEDVQRAYQRVADVTTKQSDIEIKGILKGILLESWKFDFTDEDDKTITGSISGDLSEEEVTNFIVTFFNKKCLATFQLTTVNLSNGRIKESFLLKMIQPIEDNSI